MIISSQIVLQFIPMFQIKGKQIEGIMDDPVILISERQYPGIQRIMVFIQFIGLARMAALSGWKW